jgi:hypothetical protein
MSNSRFSGWCMNGALYSGCNNFYFFIFVKGGGHFNLVVLVRVVVLRIYLVFRLWQP